MFSDHSKMFLCEICGEDLFQSQHPPRWSEKVVTVRCGHTFHHVCINRVWSINNPDGSDVSRFKCPKCPAATAEPKVFELYVSTIDEDELDSDVDAKEELDTLQKLCAANDRKLGNLKQELTKLKKEMTELSQEDNSIETMQIDQ